MNKNPVNPREPVRLKLRGVVEGSKTRAGLWFTAVVQLLILISLVSFSVETLPDLSPRTASLLGVVEVVTVALFTLEYLLRLWVAERPLRYVFSFYGLIDLVAIAPFYVSTGIDLRAVRVFRLMRVFRLLKLARYSKAAQRFLAAFREVREELVLFFSLTLVTLFVAATGIYYFERAAQPEVFKSVFHSLWWAIATLSTVGYGDAIPVTIGGRIFTGLVLLIGLGIVAVPSGLLASALTRQLQREDQIRRERPRID